MPEFDFAILGAGAIGSILGAHLARAGQRVAMLARGSRAAHLERHGLACWVASRDIGPGENFQEAIVKAIRSARAMVLVFTGRQQLGRGTLTE